MLYIAGLVFVFVYFISSCMLVLVKIQQFPYMKVRLHVCMLIYNSVLRNLLYKTKHFRQNDDSLHTCSTSHFLLQVKTEQRVHVCVGFYPAGFTW